MASRPELRNVQKTSNSLVELRMSVPEWTNYVREVLNLYLLILLENPFPPQLTHGDIEQETNYMWMLKCH
jgi:hypothetical protein